MTHRDEARERDGEDVRRVSTELAGRLAALGIRLQGTEDPEELLDIIEAIERFEDAVQAHGGDLMVDEGPGGHTVEPDDRHFGLPVRGEHETVADYVRRLARATDEVRRHPPRAD